MNEQAGRKEAFVQSRSEVTAHEGVYRVYRKRYNIASYFFLYFHLRLFHSKVLSGLLGVTVRVRKGNGME